MSSFPVFDLSKFTNASPAEKKSLGHTVDEICRQTGFLAITGHRIPDETITRAWNSARAFFDLPVEKKLAVKMRYEGYPYGYSPRRQTGFLAITGHGIPDETITRAWNSARAFFDLPVEKKLAVKMRYEGYPYGYSPLQSEALANQKAKTPPPDIKETFNIGPLDVPSEVPPHTRNEPFADFRYATNIWPAEPAPNSSKPGPTSSALSAPSPEKSCKSSPSP